jgi:hypothetical protein
VRREVGGDMFAVSSISLQSFFFFGVDMVDLQGPGYNQISTSINLSNSSSCLEING